MASISSIQTHRLERRSTTTIFDLDIPILFWPWIGCHCLTTLLSPHLATVAGLSSRSATGRPTSMLRKLRNGACRIGVDSGHSHSAFLVGRLKLFHRPV